jgi:hypothetical protein
MLQTHILRIKGGDEKEYLTRAHGFVDQGESEDKNKKLDAHGGLLQVVGIILAEHLFNLDQQPNDLDIRLFWRGASECIMLDIHFYDTGILQDALMFTTGYEGKKALIHLENELKKMTDYKITRLVV